MMANEQTPNTVKPGRRRWVKPLLIISLAINLAVAGLVVGAVFGDKRHSRNDSAIAGGMRPYLSALPEAKRPMVRQKLQANRETLKMSRKRMREASQTIRHAIAADPFEAEALKRAFAGQRSLYNGLAEGSHDALVDIIGTMTDAERVAFLDRLKKFRRKPGPDGGKSPRK
jgi:uncharacterized membrane protein